jgi:hypothetical protein
MPIDDEDTLGIWDADRWESGHVEHLAARADERGDTTMEQLCDEVLAHKVSVGIVVSIAALDSDYRTHMERYVHVGPARRPAK